MNQNFAAIILGGTGQVGGAAVAELLAIPECREVVMVTRKPIAARSRVRNVVLDIDFRHSLLGLRQAQGGRKRMLPIGRTLRNTLDLYLQSSAAQRGDADLVL